MTDLSFFSELSLGFMELNAALNTFYSQTGFVPYPSQFTTNLIFLRFFLGKRQAVLDINR